MTGVEVLAMKEIVVKTIFDPSVVNLSHQITSAISSASSMSASLCSLVSAS